MSVHLTETIRVAPLVRKFLSKHYDTFPFRLHGKNNPYGAFLINSLDNLPAKESFRQYESLTAEMQVSLTDNQIRTQKNARHFNPQKLIAFNAFVQQSFLQMATREMVVRVETGEKVIRAAELILKRYDMTEDDLSLDTLVRYYNAYGKSIMGLVKVPW